MEAALYVTEADLVERGGAIHVALARWFMPEGKQRSRTLWLERGDTSEVVLGQACVGVCHREELVAYAPCRYELEGNVCTDLASQTNALSRRQATLSREPVDHEYAHAFIAAQPHAASELTQRKPSTQCTNAFGVRGMNRIA